MELKTGRRDSGAQFVVYLSNAIILYFKNFSILGTFELPYFHDSHTVGI